MIRIAKTIDINRADMTDALSREAIEPRTGIWYAVIEDSDDTRYSIGSADLEQAIAAVRRERKSGHPYARIMAIKLTVTDSWRVSGRILATIDDDI